MKEASKEEIEDVCRQLAAIANDPNMTIVIEHIVEYDVINREQSNKNSEKKENKS